jgi:hypothetical protein
MAATQFSVAFGGPAVDDGTMPIRDLAPALLALGDVFSAASRTLYPDREPVALNIKANPSVARSRSICFSLLLALGTCSSTFLGRVRQTPSGTLNRSSSERTASSIGSASAAIVRSRLLSRPQSREWLR